MLDLQTVLEPFGPACAIFLTDEQVALLGSTRTPPVLVTIGGTTARLRVARMGGQNCIGLSKEARARLGVDIGEQVRVTIAPDTAERTVEVPPELAAALDAEPGARKAFDELSYTRRKELARGVAEAKRPQTKERRVAAAVEELRSR